MGFLLADVRVMFVTVVLEASQSRMLITLKHVQLGSMVRIVVIRVGVLDMCLMIMHNFTMVWVFTIVHSFTMVWILIKIHRVLFVYVIML